MSIWKKYKLIQNIIEPWCGKTKEELLLNIISKILKFPQFPQVDEDSKSFITQCLELNEDNRIGWNDIYRHPLVKNCFCDVINQINLRISLFLIRLNSLLQKLKR